MRPAAQAEAALAADIMTASFPREPQDPILTARRWEHPKAGWRYGRTIAELAGEPVGLLEWQHGSWDLLPERHCWLEVWLDRKHRDDDLLAFLYRAGEDAARADGALTINTACGEDEPHYLRVLPALGYERDRTDRVWALDLHEHGPGLIAAAEEAWAAMRTSGIEITTLARWHDSERFPKLYQLHELTRLDVPHTSPVLPQTLDDFMVRIESPDTPADRRWIALDGSDPVATSYLSYPPVRGPVWTQYTASHPRYRGRGIARAVKLQSLAQAVRLGVPEVRTANDSENPAMLHINETLGYTLQPGFVSFTRRLSGPGLR